MSRAEIDVVGAIYETSLVPSRAKPTGIGMLTVRFNGTGEYMLFSAVSVGRPAKLERIRFPGSEKELRSTRWTILKQARAMQEANFLIRVIDEEFALEGELGRAWGPNALLPGSTRTLGETLHLACFSPMAVFDAYH